MLRTRVQMALVQVSRAQAWSRRCSSTPVPGAARAAPHDQPCAASLPQPAGTISSPATSAPLSSFAAWCKLDLLSSEESLEPEFCRGVVSFVWRPEIYLPANICPLIYLSFSCLMICKSISSLWFGNHATISERHQRWSSELLSNMDK